MKITVEEIYNHFMSVLHQRGYATAPISAGLSLTLKEEELTAMFNGKTSKVEIPEKALEGWPNVFDKAVYLEPLVDGLAEVLPVRTKRAR